MKTINIYIALDEQMMDCEGEIVGIERNHRQVRPICKVISINEVPAKWLNQEALNEARSQLELSDDAKHEVEFVTGQDGEYGDRMDAGYERMRDIEHERRTA